jgi:amylosucrase
MSHRAPAAVIDAANALLAEEPEADRTVFEARVHRWWPDLVDGLTPAYGDRVPELTAGLVELAARRFLERSAELRQLDLQRLVAPDWFQSPSALGYAAYTERLAGTLRGVIDRVPYLAELGVTYLHLMPLLEPRPRPNDGGYAVVDYRTVRADLAPSTTSTR